MFTLHPQLAADTIPVGRFPLSLLLLMNDASYPWFILVPARPGLTELHELDEADALALMGESRALSRALVAAFGGDKLNVAALGNVVPQLHVHHVVRFRGDAAWPRPVWGVVPPVAMSAAQAAERRAAVVAALAREGAAFMEVGAGA